MSKSFIICKFGIEGFHAWEGAYEKVSFLKNKHRHIFYISVGVAVKGLNREIEIFDKTWEIQDFLSRQYGKPCEFGGMSCEMIASEILKEFQASWVEVLEDALGGARRRGSENGHVVAQLC